MHQDQCVEIARGAAVACHERHDCMPPTPLLAEVWMPHRWVVDAMLLAAHVAEQERDRYKAGNTELLGLWMKLLDGQDIIDVQERVREILEGAGLLRDGKPDWAALEARKPKQKTWEEAVNECVTDPEARTRLLALDDFMGADSIDDLVDFVCDEYALDAILHAAPARCNAAHLCDCQEAGQLCARALGPNA